MWLQIYSLTTLLGEERYLAIVLHSAMSTCFFCKEHNKNPVLARGLEIYFLVNGKFYSGVNHYPNKKHTNNG